MKKAKSRKYKNRKIDLKNQNGSSHQTKKRGTTTIWLRNKMYKFIKTHVLPRDSWGLCTDPSFSRREIKIHKKLRGMKELEIIIHEMLHACFWDIDEKVIKEVAIDISKSLWKIGYRK